ncbi:hypothetical protein BCC0238_004095 [Burkholderia gladioli]
MCTQRKRRAGNWNGRICHASPGSVATRWHELRESRIDPRVPQRAVRCNPFVTQDSFEIHADSLAQSPASQVEIVGHCLDAISREARKDERQDRPHGLAHQALSAKGSSSPPADFEAPRRPTGPMQAAAADQGIGITEQKQQGEISAHGKVGRPISCVSLGGFQRWRFECPRQIGRKFAQHLERFDRCLENLPAVAYARRSNDQVLALDRIGQVNEDGIHGRSIDAPFRHLNSRAPADLSKRYRNRPNTREAGHPRPASLPSHAQRTRAFNFSTSTSPNSGADIGCCPVISSRSTTTLLCQFATESTCAPASARAFTG